MQKSAEHVPRDCISRLDSRLEIPVPTRASGFARFEVWKMLTPRGQQSSDAADFAPIFATIGAGCQVILNSGAVLGREIADGNGANFFPVSAAGMMETRHIC